MRAVIQRVNKASVSVEGELIAQIGSGLLILIGVTHEDTVEDVEWLARKIPSMRIFQDEAGKMNSSVIDVSGEVIVVSQFTLYASNKKGNRPSFTNSASPDIAIKLYQLLIHKLNSSLPQPCQKGEFGADMQVSLINDGPVTIILDTKLKE
ncbi:D-aminoacyl-tRNA deacylase [Akkermansiaceae bacterium]|nr:D-aminoacyl-tRNA deacylase [Akkermansiaceae bacterium]